LAISKILNMKDCGGHFHGKHLKRSLDYVMNPEKTQDGRLIGAINCQVDSAFEQMKATKRKFATVYKGNIIKNLIMDCQSYTKYRPNETTGGIFVSWRRKEELPTGA
jgi:hypothetical protein